MDSKPMDSIECIVIGAGVVGLAVARALALKGHEVLVLEAAAAIGTGISARNSEVIHAGLYYPTGSLKATLCVQGRQLLYDYCAERHIGHSRCGKLIVATDESQRSALQQVMVQGAANGVHDLVLLSGLEAQQMEPALACVAAVQSPSTGIVDSHALMLSLLGDLEHSGGVLALNTPVVTAEFTDAAIKIVASDGTRLTANIVINAAGLQAPLLAQRFGGLAPQHVPSRRFAKGSYFSLTGRTPFQRLIYPVPVAAGLGVHLTIDLSGQAKFGPDVEWVARDDDWQVNPARGDAFYSAIRRYWPGLPDGALQPGYAGIRPKLQPPGPCTGASSGDFVSSDFVSGDFVIQGPAAHGIPGLVNLFGIESPGLTSCLAIGEHVARLV